MERLALGREGLETLQSVHEDMPKYINKAVAGENNYNLQIDKEWSQFIYESTKMSLVKLFVLLIGIAPSLTKFPSFFMQKLVINGCYLYNSSQTPLALSECIKSNGNSVFVERKLFSSKPGDIIGGILILLMLSLPHLIFIAIIWIRFRTNKYTVWMSSAKIQLTTFDKRVLAFGYFLGCFFLIAFSLLMSSFMVYMNENFFRRDYFLPYNSSTYVALTFEKSDANDPVNIISSALIYTCLLTVLFNHTREPMSFFTGFRMYLKKASHVTYNITAVEFRIERNPLTWKLVKMYYEQCQRYAPNIVLNAMTTHFIDLKILKADELNESFVSVTAE